MAKKFECECGFSIDVENEKIEKIVCPICNKEIKVDIVKEKSEIGLSEADAEFRKKYYEKRKAEKEDKKGVGTPPRKKTRFVPIIKPPADEKKS